MATFFFDGGIAQESVMNLVKLIDEHEDMDIDLYFTSGGGDLTYAYVLTHYLSNSIKDITLIIHWEIASAAIEVMVNSVCKKVVLEDAFGALHFATRDYNARELRDPSSTDSFLKRELEEWNEYFLNKYCKFLNENEISLVSGGGTVYLAHDRFIDFFKTYATIYIEENEDVSKGGV